MNLEDQSNADQHAGLRVRPATPRDRSFVLRLAARFGTTRAAWRTSEEVVAGTERQLARAFDEPREGDTILIAVAGDGEPLGFAYVVTHDDFFTAEAHGHISELATVADGSGAGSALMRAAEAWSRERGFRYLSLNVNDANDAAREFYERREYIPEYRHLVKLLAPSPGLSGAVSGVGAHHPRNSVAIDERSE